MLFPTFNFAVFFVIVLIVSWILHKWQIPWKIFLLLASYFFYGSGNAIFLILIIYCSLSSYFFSLQINKTRNLKLKKRYLIFSVVSCLSVLGFFKYFDFFAESFNGLFYGMGLKIPLLEIILPVGISFFTFQAMSYVIDVYRNEIEPEKSSVGLLNFLIYISFFPQLVAGPIVRARTFLPQLKAGYIKAVPNIHLAFSLIFGGLFKKLIISTYLQVHIVDLVLKSPSTHSPIEILLAIYGFSAQIYCDFSGYSDIAIGTALLMGFKFPDNFDSPYRAVNIQDFWRRWHITLSTWLKDYLYIPLGGNRKGKFLTYINLMITMLLGGLWHGASLTFIVWGGFHGIALVVNKIWTNIKHKYNLGFGNGKLIRGVSIFITFHFVSFLWVFFYHKDFSSALDVFSSLINFDVSLTEIDLYVIFAIFIGIGVHFFGDRIRNYYLSLMYSTNYMVHTVANAVLMILLINISPKTVPPFIYFQF